MFRRAPSPAARGRFPLAILDAWAVGCDQSICGPEGRQPLFEHLAPITETAKRRRDAWPAHPPLAAPVPARLPIATLFVRSSAASASCKGPLSHLASSKSSCIWPMVRAPRPRSRPPLRTPSSRSCTGLPSSSPASVPAAKSRPPSSAEAGRRRASDRPRLVRRSNRPHAPGAQPSINARSSAVAPGTAVLARDECASGSGREEMLAARAPPRRPRTRDGRRGFGPIAAMAPVAGSTRPPSTISQKVVHRVRPAAAGSGETF